jgi:hypothetical protein
VIICGQCGEHNPTTVRFCRACEAYLAWEDDRADEPVPVTGPAEAAEPRLAAGPADAAEPRVGAGLADAAEPSAVAGSADAAERRLVARSAEPAPLQPAEPTAPRRRQVEAPQERPARIGDRFCGRCGADNPPTRQFCRRCAAPLAEAVTARQPWWRRMLARLVQRWRGVHRSGQRPARRASASGVFLGSVRRTSMILLVLALLGYVLVPPVRGWANPAAREGWHRVRSLFSPKYVPVRPTQVASNRELAGHSAALAIDTVTTTYWAAQDGDVEPTLVFTFERPVDLRRAIVHNGAGQDFQHAHRARQLHLVFSTGHTADVTLLDSPDPQTVDIPSYPDADRVELHVVSLYHAVRGTELAIAEIEFFERRR